MNDANNHSYDFGQTGLEQTIAALRRAGIVQDNPGAFAKMAVRAGADLVLGSGPHVLRGMEIYRGRLIAYSLGNFSGFHNFETAGVLGASAVLHVTLDPDGAYRSGRIASVRLVEAGQPVPD